MRAKHQRDASKTSKQSAPEKVSLILWEGSKYRRLECGLVKREEEKKRGKMTGKEGKMRSSIKSPYVSSLSSTLAPGIRARRASVRASRPVRAALLSLPLLQGPFLLDTGADLLLKLAHLLLQLTDQIDHALRRRRRRDSR